MNKEQSWLHVMRIIFAVDVQCDVHNQVLKISKSGAEANGGRRTQLANPLRPSQVFT
jgi:hypothetical protein